MTTYVTVKLRVEGIHCWPECPFGEVEFLRTPHRHVFHIVCVKQVTHTDRDVEIIMLKRQVIAALGDLYGTPCDFGRMSCEAIATKLVEFFGLSVCEVLEDGENGAVVQA